MGGIETLSEAVRLLTCADVAAAMQVGLSSVQKKASRVGGYRKLGQLVRFDRRAFERWLDEGCPGWEGPLGATGSAGARGVIASIGRPKRKAGK